MKSFPLQTTTNPNMSRFVAVILVSTTLAPLLFLQHSPALAGEPHSRVRQPVVGQAIETADYLVTIVAVDQVQEPLHKRLLWHYTFRAEDRKSRAIHLLEYFDNFGTIDNELRWFGIEGDWLYVLRDITLGVFSLATGKHTVELTVRHPAVSPRGDVIAYVVRQIGYAGSNLQGSIVGVLDLATAKRRYVFPEPTTIREFRDGEAAAVMGPENDLYKQHSVDEIFWTASGDRLAFLCAHGFNLPPKAQMYLVVVDLIGSTGSHFVHQPLAPQLYRKPGEKAPLSAVYFEAASMTWIDARTIAIRPKANYSADIRDKFIVKLSEAPK